MGDQLPGNEDEAGDEVEYHLGDEAADGGGRRRIGRNVVRSVARGSCQRQYALLIHSINQILLLNALDLHGRHIRRTSDDDSDNDSDDNSDDDLPSVIIFLLFKCVKWFLKF
jgi:hypothetical protein